MKSIVNYLLLFILISSCTKFGKNVTIKGKVLNPITGEAIPNAEIWLQKTTTGLPGGMKTIKTATTDSNGDYELNKFSLRASSAICVLGSDYYKIGWKDANTGENMGNPTLNISKGKTMEVDFWALPYGDYQLSINNTSCNGPTDTIIINQTNYAKSFLGNDWILTGCVNQITSVSKVPMGNIHTVFTVIKMGVTTVYESDFMVQPDQLNVQTINY